MEVVCQLDEACSACFVRQEGEGRGAHGLGGDALKLVRCDLCPTSYGLLRLGSLDGSRLEDDEVAWMGISASGQDIRNNHRVHGKWKTYGKPFIVIACTASSFSSHLQRHAESEPS